jgi:SAM-dependent methyltransferase
MMNKEDKERLLSLYEERLEKYGNNFKTAGWGSAEDQNLRFDMLFRDLDISNKSVLDLGCGLGDLVNYLDNKKVENFQYTGIDLSEKLIIQAKCNHSRANVKFIAQDVLNEELPKADIVVVSGMLTFNIEGNKDNIKKIMQKLFVSSNEVLAINFMSSYVDFELEKNLHFSPEKIFSYAKEITHLINIYHDYPLYEFTIQLKKGRL